MPSHDAAVPIRPLRRKLSSRCTTMKERPRGTAALAAASTASRSSPAADERAAATATNPTPAAADRAFTTRTAGPNSRATATAVLKVLDSAAERCTATTPSPPLSANALRYASARSAGAAPAVVTCAPVVDVVRHRIDTVSQIHAIHQDVQRHLTNSPPLQLIGVESRGRVGDHHDGHDQSPATSDASTPASARPFIINSATAVCASKFQ